MSETITWICNCGCQKQASEENRDYWLILSQQKDKDGDLPIDEGKLDGNLHFSNLKCLQRWADNARRILPALKRKSNGLNPRGRITSLKVPGLYI